ncbi:MAG: cyclic nucleotide-binding domain-containing protein [Spirochaetes bacterium]|nr:cyclic nucleotide-binding domain-containing protein [Spirochaetota bacterium]
MSDNVPAAQLTLATFKKGSFIIIEGKRDNDCFFIIKVGQVRVSKEAELADTENQLFGPGDFFGVVSAMSGHLREETAQAMTDVSLIAVKKDQFGLLIQRNTPVAMKIIRSFSQKLRHFDQSIMKLTSKDESGDDTENLYVIAEYYHNLGNRKLAMYAYVRYLQINPNGLNVANVKARLSELGEVDPTIGKPVTVFNIRKKEGEFIFCEHEPGNELYILQEGKVKITKIVSGSEVLLAVLQPGDIFGEMAILENKPRNASAISYGDSLLLAVNKANVENMVKTQPQLATRLIQILSERIWMAYRHLANLMLKDPLGRLYDMLLTHIEKNHITIEKKKPFVFNFGAKELISMVGLPPADGRVAITKMMDNKTFSIKDNKLMVSDIDEVQRQTEYYRKMYLLDQKREQAKGLR